MSTFSPFSSSRAFQVWENEVSHGHLLIRSPRSPGTLDEPKQTTNVDLHFWGVDYFYITGILTCVEIVMPTGQEVERLVLVVEKQLQPVTRVVFLSGNT